MQTDSTRWLLLSLLALGTGCEDTVPEPESRPVPTATPADRTETTAKPKKKAEDVDALKKEDLKVGKGKEAKTGDTVEVHYTGTLLDGTKFDSSVGGKPFSFTLGKGMVIKGWDQGVVGMKVGGKRKLTIPSKLGYGKRGSPPKIPPNAALVFEIELLAVK